MSELLQSHYRAPSFRNDPSFAPYIQERLRIAWGKALMERLFESQGAIVGPIHETQEEVSGYVSDEPEQMFGIWAHVEMLPEAPEYEFLGGPYHKQEIRTDGSRTYRLPLPPPPNLGQFSIMDDVQPILAAVYERMGDSTAYTFSRVERA